MDRELLKVDAMYALSEMFSVAAASESQFLNMIHQKINDDLDFLNDEMEASLLNLRYYKGMLDDHADEIKDIISFIQNGGDPSWPRAKDSSQADSVNAVLTELIYDFESLLSRANGLARKCKEGIENIVSSASLLESRKAIKKAEAMERLSRLAFFFLPLSFTASFFGINCREFGSGKQSIWVAGLLLLLSVAVSTVLCFWDAVNTYCTKKKPRN